MKNKAYLVRRLCQLRNIDVESQEAADMYSRKVVDLLIEIKKSTPEVPEPDPQQQPDEEEEFLSLAQRLGCS
jgi:hypothetical protein